MGYDIYIGNTTMEPIVQYEDEEVYVTPYHRVIEGKLVYFKPEVNRFHHPDAPTFPDDEMTGNGNHRHPGYANWSHFVTMVGLNDLFFNKQDGLMRDHPGHAELNSDHAAIITKALATFKADYPHAIARFGDGATQADAHLARLIWLDWWVRWTLENCEHAGIYNF